MGTEEMGDRIVDAIMAKRDHSERTRRGIARAKERRAVKLGATYEVKTEAGGRFVAVADHFERDGHVVVLIPVWDLVRDVYPNGYELGSAHWRDCLTELDRADSQ